MPFISLGVLSASSLPFLMVSFSLLVWLSIISTLENQKIVSGDKLFCFFKNFFLLLAAILFTELTHLTSTVHPEMHFEGSIVCTAVTSSSCLGKNTKTQYTERDLLSHRLFRDLLSLFNL